MKVAITADVADENSPVSMVFGRCAYYAIYDTETNRLDFVPNPGAMIPRGAGVQAGQFLVEQGVQMLITGGMTGPNATMVLNQAGIRIINGFTGRIRDAIEQLRSGRLGGVSYQRTPYGSAGTELSPEDELRMLEEEKARIEERLEEIKRRLRELKK